MAFKWLLNKMKENPLNVPEDLKGLAKIEKQQDFTALEKYMDGLSNSDKRMDTEILTSTYDPDTVEWMNNIKKKFV